MPKKNKLATTTSNEPYYELAQDSAGWHWLLWSGNGRPLARNAAPYVREKDAIQAINAMPGNVKAAKAIVRAGGEEAVDDATPAG